MRDVVMAVVILFAVAAGFIAWARVLDMTIVERTSAIYDTQVEIDRLGEAAALVEQIETLKANLAAHTAVIEELERHSQESFRKARLQIEEHQDLHQYKYFKE